jgi:hypothetical protein
MGTLIGVDMEDDAIFPKYRQSFPRAEQHPQREQIVATSFTNRCVFGEQYCDTDEELLFKAGGEVPNS